MLKHRIRFAGVAASALALAVLAAPAQAQFGGLLRGSRASERSSDGCSEGRSRSAGSRIAGGVAASTLALAVLAAPAQAQFGGLLRGSRSSERSSDGCSEGRSRSAGSRIAGGVLGSVAGSVAGRAGGVFNWVPVSGLTDQLTAAIACKLDPEEQKQAAEATLEATRVGDDGADVDVGAMSAWKSDTREDVSGTSTVVAKNDADSAGVQCITVADVIIVSGEETRAEKRMCRQPPGRYALAA